MPGFDVLDKDLELYRNHFLEASAGTGKTFAIENIVARLLMDENGSEIDQILVVTFTRAATVELKTRIHVRLQEILWMLHERMNLPSFLKSLVEKGENSILKAKRKLQTALAGFDDAKIFTIHSFCFHSLKESAFEAGIAFDRIEEGGATGALKRIIKDQLRTEISSELMSQKQLVKLLKKHDNDINQLISKLLPIVTQKIPIQPVLTFQQIAAALRSEMNSLKRCYSVKGDRLLEDLLTQAPMFGKLTSLQREVKSEVLDGFREFVAFFEGEEIDFVDSPILKMSPQNALKKRSISKPLNYPDLLDSIQKTIIPLLQEASDESALFALVAEKVRKQVEKATRQEEIFFFEDLLHLMDEKTRDLSFAQDIRSQYRAVLIDEFQDTDPIQWNIFSRLFNTPEFHGPLYLVGDPKQSIYRFRRADIYTYLKAKDAMGPDYWASLQCNYRSDPQLVNGLNQLFLAAPDFISLPKLKRHLPFIPVEADPKRQSLQWGDGKKSIHFCKAENENEIFDFIAEEIKNLHFEEKIAWCEFSILVKDRYQGSRILNFLRMHSIPAVTKKAASLRDSCAFQIFQKLLECVNNPRDSQSLIYLLGTPLFACTLDEIIERKDQWMENFYQLNRVFVQEGIFAFFHKILDMQGVTLLQQEDGEEIYQDLLQLAEITASHIADSDIDKISTFLEQLMQEDPESEILQARQNSQVNSVQVLTIHVSKGLEFEVVFPVGLILEPSKKRELVLSTSILEYRFDENSRNQEEEESLSERMRQLYVAFTRAKKRLYLPFLEKGESPMKIFLDRVFNGEPPETFVKRSQGMSFSVYQPQMSKKFSECLIQNIMIPPKKVDLDIEPIQIHSFSSIVQKVRGISPKEVLKKNSPSNEEMPSSSEVGILLHAILESILFEEAISKLNAEEIIPMISPMVEDTLLEKWKREVAEIVFNAFKTPLMHQGKPFSLSDINPKKIIKEMEFIFSSNEPKGYMKGFIDLIFEHEGKYYFLDWKSNYLGEASDDYNQEKMAEAIDAHAYLLQAKIYQEALIKYLSLFGVKKECFGGFFYVFLRGIADNGNGIFYHE